MGLLYRTLLRLATAVFAVTAIALAILIIASFRETTWSNVHWGVIVGVLLGPAGILIILAWVIKPPN